MICGVGSYQAGCAGRNGRFSIFPASRQNQTIKKKGKVGGRKEWKNKRKEVCGLAAPGPGHQKPGPIPGDCAASGASPGSERREASLQSCCCLSAGRAGALAGHIASSSPFHPGRALMSLPTDRSCCFLWGWMGSTAASHKPLMALICLSLGPRAARLVLDSRSQRAVVCNPAPPSPTKAIRTLCLAGEGRANTLQTTPGTATLP